jgi:Ni/Co efflux regulator RcnB
MTFSALRIGALAVALALTSTAGWAGKPDHAGGGRDDDRYEKREKGHGNKHRGDDDRQGRYDDRRDDRREVYRDGYRDGYRTGDRSGSGVSVNIQIGGYFNDSQRRVAVDYYQPQFRAGKCPPGLAKKGNGCMPPGQAKAWRRGYALPPDVVYYPVPSSVSVRLGTPPAGYKYVRVAADILLIAVGTAMVVDAIEDLGNL